jgi:hypothetical protein
MAGMTTVTSNVLLRDLTGYDERAIGQACSAAAIDLIGRLAEGVPADFALQLSASARDRILVRIYSDLYGNRIETTLNCGTCGKLFDLSLELSELMRGAEAGSALASPAGDGTYVMADGVRFRLPTGADELRIRDLPREKAVYELLECCVLDGRERYDPRAVQDAMEQVAPIIDVDINTSCPECGSGTRVRFDLQEYLLRSLMQERRRLWRETHILATAYGWGLNDILGLTRSDRRTLVDLIEGGAARRTGA